jgi:hypothetical protein
LTADSPSTLHVIAAGARLHPILQATSWQGEIAALYHRSILCTAANGRLLHLHTGPQLASPFSLRIAGEFATVFCQAPLVRGMRVRKIGAALDIAEHVQLSLDDVSYYQSPVHMTAVVDADAVKLAWQLLRSNGRGDGFEQLPGAQTIIDVMQRGLADSNLAHMLDAARHLIGWGPGLTPSGDDVLVGCLRGLWLIGKSQPALYEMLDRCRDALLPDLHVHTTRVGGEFIRYALDGAFAEVLDQAALSLLDVCHPPVLQSAVTCLLTQGESSGTDTMLGLLRCLEALSRVFGSGPSHQGQDGSSISLMSTATRR